MIQTSSQRSARRLLSFIWVRLTPRDSNMF